MAAENFKVKKGLEVGTGATITSSGINVTGIITATQLVGDGSGLTGVTGSGSGVIVKHDGSAVGTAGTINFSTNLDVSAIHLGIVTVTASTSGISDVVVDTTPELGGNLSLNGKDITGSGDIDITGNLKISGIATVGTLKGAIEATSASFSAAIDANSDLDVDGQTDLDVTRISQGLNVTAGITTLGVTTTTNLSGQQLNVSGIGSIGTGTGGVAKLFFNGQQKLITTGTGIEVPDLSVTGVGTIGRMDTSGVTLGTNSTTFAAKFTDNAVANFGSDNDLKISHNNTDAIFENTTGQFVFKDTSGEAEFKIQAHEGNQASLFLFADEGDDPQDRWRATAHTDGNLVLNYWRSATNAYAKTAQFANNGGTQLFHTAVKKFETTEYGVVVSGVCTATSFSGDGSGLTGVTGSGSGIIIQHDGSAIGTAGTINFSTNLDVSPVHLGIVTVTASGGGSNASTFTVTDNNSTDETVYPIFVDGATGSQGAESDTNLYYNPNSNILTAGTFSGDLTGNVTGNATSADGVDVGAVSTNSDLRILFTTNDGGAGRTIGCSSGSDDFTFNPSSQALGVGGSITANSFSGSGIGLTSLNADKLGSGTIPNARFPATLPAASGANLTALNASEITSGTLPIARVADNAVTFAKMQDVGTGVIIGRNDGGSGDMETLSASEVRTLLNVADGATAGITTAASNVTATWNITASDNSDYEFTGPGQDGSEDDPNIYLMRGHRYRFVNTTGNSHPFEFRNAANDADYTDGITGAQNGTQEFNVQHDAPAALKYRCTIHTGSMLGNIYIVGLTINNNGNNRIITGSSLTQLEAEDSFTYNGVDEVALNHVSTNENTYITLNANANRRKAILFKNANTTGGCIGLGDSDEGTSTSLFLSAKDDVAGASPHVSIDTNGETTFAGIINQGTPGGDINHVVKSFGPGFLGNGSTADLTLDAGQGGGTVTVHSFRTSDNNLSKTSVFGFQLRGTGTASLGSAIYSQTGSSGTISVSVAAIAQGIRFTNNAGATVKYSVTFDLTGDL